MPDYSLLTTFQLCDDADERVSRKLLTYENVNQNADFDDTRAGWTAESRTKRLAKADGDIAMSTAVLALPTTIGDLRTTHEIKLRNAQTAKQNLLARTQGGDAVEQFMDQEEAEAAAADIDRLTTIKGRIATQRATLTA